MCSIFLPITIGKSSDLHGRDFRVARAGRVVEIDDDGEFYGDRDEDEMVALAATRSFDPSSIRRDDADGVTRPQNRPAARQRKMAREELAPTLSPTLLARAMPWTVTITMAEGQAAGLAILSQDGTTVTGMIGPAETDMMPADGTVSGDKLVLTTRPRTGRTAVFAKCEVTVAGDRMTGTIDAGKGTIAFVKSKRS